MVLVVVIGTRSRLVRIVDDIAEQQQRRHHNHRHNNKPSEQR